MATAETVLADCPDNDGDDYVVFDDVCTIPPGKQAGDCNDNDDSIYPGAPELLCDGIDQDCSGADDEGTDNDADTFKVEGGLCGPIDCNDNDDSIYPGATEYCSDDVDSNCSGETDAQEFRLGEPCGLCSGPDCDFDFCFQDECPAPGGAFCLTGSLVVCSDDDLSSTCQLTESPLTPYSPEGPAGDATCFDLLDNDCNGLSDHQEPTCQGPELCDGFDNDGDGDIDEDFTVGAACDNGGIGLCYGAGVEVCNEDGSGTVCTAPVKPPKTEGPGGSSTCSDGFDNDCDGLTDFPNDPSCTSAELCDGLDNDGDGDIDEDFTDLGDACNTGQGACFATGQRICSPDRQGTTCNAIAGLASPEGPTGPTCSDAIDNDCDGFTDEADPICGSAGLNAWCSLAFDRRPRQLTCDSVHEIAYGFESAAPGAKVVAELLALDETGKIIDAILVENGDLAQLTSSTDATKYRFETKTTPLGPRHVIVAPVPLLRITVDDGLNQARAYCSHVPYLQVVEPADAVVSESLGDLTPVLVALPLVDLGSLTVRVDGVDVISALGIDPDTDFPGGPFNGAVNINDQAVQVIDLRVQGGAVGDQSSNTLSMSLANLGCGGHIVVVESDGARVGSFPARPPKTCHKDEFKAKGNSSGFYVEIFSPTPQQVVSDVPTPVTGQVCHGKETAEIKINGKELLEVEQLDTFIPGDWETSADTYLVDFQTALGQTDLAEDFSSGDTPLGTFDAGTNRLIAEAVDEAGNRTFKTLMFATGNVAAPGLSELTQPFLDDLKEHVEQELRSLAAEQLMNPANISAVEVENAFVLGLTPNAINTVFSERCTEAAQQFLVGVQSKLQIGKVINEQSISGGCSCNPTVRTRITGFSLDPNTISCPVTFLNDKINVLIDLPDVGISLSAHGHCKTELDLLLGKICIAETIVNADASIQITDLKVEFDITEGQLLGTEPAGDPIRGYCSDNPAQGCSVNGDCGGECVVATVNTVVTNPSVQVNCLASICNWVFNIFAAIINGIAGQQIIQPVLISFTLDDLEFTTQIGADEVDPFELEEIKVDEEQIAEYEQEVSGELSSVEITPAGLIAGLTGSFATLVIDPEVEETPGALLTPAPVPSMAILTAAGGQDASVLLADDTINMMFASMTEAGKLKSGCVDSSKTVDDLLPANCDDIAVELDTPEASEAATDAAQGLCHGVKGTDCETLAGANIALTPIEQGICHGVQGATCSMIPAGLAGLVMPADCSTIVIDTPDNPGLGDTATAITQGYCYGSQAAVCEDLSGPTDGLTAYMQGACHGAQAASCQDIPTAFLTAGVEKGTCEGVEDNGCDSLSGLQPISCALARTVDTILKAVEQETCEGTPPINLSAEQPLLFCSRQDAPPTFKVIDESATDAVETAVRLNDMSMAIVVDRDDPPNGSDAELGAIPDCFAEDAPSVGDCTLAALCLDINLISNMQFATCDDGKPGLVTEVTDVQAIIRQAGVVCGGVPAGDDDALVDNSAAGNESIDIVRQNSEDYSPPVCANGLTLGGFVNFVDPELIAVETDGDSDFQDYLGLTGAIEP